MFSWETFILKRITNPQCWPHISHSIDARRVGREGWKLTTVCCCHFLILFSGVGGMAKPARQMLVSCEFDNWGLDMASEARPCWMRADVDHGGFCDAV